MNRSLRIAILTHSTNPRGGVVHALAVAEALMDLGHTAAVHAPDPSGQGYFRQARCGTVSVPASSVAALGTAVMVERRIAEFRAYFDDPAHRDFDVYHAHDSIGGNALADLAQAGIIPGFVRTVHHLDTFAEPAVQARQIRGVKTATAVLCVSDLWRTILRRDLGVVAHRVENGVDRMTFSSGVRPKDEDVRRRWGLGGGPMFLSVGGFEVRKNTLGIIEAFAALRRDRPDAQLVVVGGASVLDHVAYASRCAEALRRHGLDVGPGRAVVRTGPVPQADMPSFYRLADALVFASLAEGFGLAVIEAMASRTPVIVSRIAPFTEYLGAEDALWCDPLIPGTIEAAMRRSLDSLRREELRRRGADVAGRFDWSTSAKRHLAIYDTLVREREASLA